MPVFDSKQSIGPVKIDPNALKKLNDLESEAITKATAAYVEADVHLQSGAQTYHLVQHEGSFARVSVGVNEGGGFSVLLKKVYGLWVAIASGQDIPGKAVGEKYGLPAGWFSTEY